MKLLAPMPSCPCAFLPLCFLPLSGRGSTPFPRLHLLSTGRSSLSLLQRLFPVLLFELHDRESVSLIVAYRTKTCRTSLTLFCSSGLNKARRLSSARRLASRFSSSVSPVSSCTSRWYSLANSWSTSARIFLNFRVVCKTFRCQPSSYTVVILEGIPRV